MKTLDEYRNTVEEYCHKECNLWYGDIGYDEIQLVCDGIYLPVLENLHRKVVEVMEPDEYHEKFLFIVH